MRQIRRRRFFDGGLLVVAGFDLVLGRVAFPSNTPLPTNEFALGCDGYKPCRFFFGPAEGLEKNFELREGGRITGSFAIWRLRYALRRLLSDALHDSGRID